MTAIAPLLFVLIWSTGFLVGRGVAPHADPFWFLAARFVCVSTAFTAAALWARVAWPRGAWHGRAARGASACTCWRARS